MAGVNRNDGNDENTRHATEKALEGKAQTGTEKKKNLQKK